MQREGQDVYVDEDDNEFLESELTLVEEENEA